MATFWKAFDDVTSADDVLIGCEPVENAKNLREIIDTNLRRVVKKHGAQSGIEIVEVPTIVTMWDRECEDYSEFGTARPVKGVDPTAGIAFVLRGVNAPLKYAGFDFVGVVDALDAGYVINSKVINEAKKTEILETLNEREGIWCDHCGTKRTTRKKGVLFAKENGELLMIAMTCARDYFGTDLHKAILARTSIFRGWEAMMIGMREPEMVNTAEVASLVWGVVTEDGRWKKRVNEYDDNYEVGTADKVNDLWCIDYADVMRNSEKWGPLWAMKRKYITQFPDALTEAKAFYETIDNKDLFTNNLSVTVNSSHAVKKFKLGLFGYGIAKVILDRKKDEERKAREAENANTMNGHVGAVGERLTMSLTLREMKAFDTAYGISVLCLFKDAEGRDLKWFASSCPLNRAEDLGKTFEVVGTIKDHSEFRGTKQTGLSRCKIKR